MFVSSRATYLSCHCQSDRSAGSTLSCFVPKSCFSRGCCDPACQSCVYYWSCTCCTSCLVTCRYALVKCRVGPRRVGSCANCVPELLLGRWGNIYGWCRCCCGCCWMLDSDDHDPMALAKYLDCVAVFWMIVNACLDYHSGLCRSQILPYYIDIFVLFLIKAWDYSQMTH